MCIVDTVTSVSRLPRYPACPGSSGYPRYPEHPKYSRYPRLPRFPRYPIGDRDQDIFCMRYIIFAHAKLLLGPRCGVLYHGGKELCFSDYTFDNSNL